MSQENNVPRITIEDISNVQKIISTATARGAFRAEEMSAVGATYDRIRAYLEFVSEQAKQASEDQAPEASKTTGTSE